MFRLSKNQEANVLKLKLQEIDWSKEYSDQDKNKLKSYYKRKLKNIDPRDKFFGESSDLKE